MAVRIFLMVKVEPGYTDKIISKLKTFEEVSLVCLIDEGPYDIIAVIDVESFDDYRIFSMDRIGSMHHLEDYTSFITLGA